MKEQVVVTTKVDNYYPKFDNPIYLAAKKEEYRQEKLRRIKSGNFLELYPLVNSSLSAKETEEIFISWWLLGREDLILAYGTALSSYNLEEIKAIDLVRMNEKEERISR